MRLLCTKRAAAALRRAPSRRVRGTLRASSRRVEILGPLEPVAREICLTLYDGGAWILFGFLIAGMLHVLVDPARLARHLGERSVRSALKAALLGAPIPLCSCGVLPMAAELRRKGASKESTLSFLITTPEVGVDSVAITAAYFGPLMAVIRPVVAVVTGVVAGALSLRLSRDEDDDAVAHDRTPADDHAVVAHAHPCGHDHAAAAETSSRAGSCAHEHVLHDASPADGGRLRHAARALRGAARYAFVELFDDLGFWITFAIVISALLGVALPADFFDRVVPSSVAAMSLMLLIGAPMYVCASASTPLAAVFVAKGASVGAALVFLLVGPATNAATMATVRRTFGARDVQIYLASVVGVAMLAGLLVDLLLPELAADVAVADDGTGEPLSLLKTAGAVLFSGLLVWSLWRTGLRPGLREIAGNARASFAWLRDAGPVRVLANPIAGGLAVLWLGAFLIEGFGAVPPGQQALVQRFGALAGAPREPGLVYALPVAEQVSLVRVDEVRERQINFTTAPGGLERIPDPDTPLYLTSDENLVDVRASVLFRVADAATFRLGVEDPGAILAALARAQLVRAVARQPMDVIYTSSRPEVEAWLLARVREEAAAMNLGVDPIAVRLLDVHAPILVHDAFRDVASAREDQLTTVHQATEYAGSTVALARGEAERLVAEAEARALERRARAAADAERFAALTAAHRASPELTEARLYIETAERTLAGARKVIRPAHGGPHGYELWLRGDAASALPPPLAAAVAPEAVVAAAPQPAPAEKRPSRVDFADILEEDSE